MTERVRRRDTLAWVLAILVVLLLLWLASCDSTVGSGNSVGGAGTGGVEAREDLVSGGVSASFTLAGLTSASVELAGDVADPVSPGSTASVDVEMTNPYDSPIVVTGITVTVQAVSAPRADAHHPCTVADFTVKQGLAGVELTVSPGMTNLSTLGVPASQWPRIGMFNTQRNQDGCKGAALTLAYAASGTQSK